MTIREGTMSSSDSQNVPAVNYSAVVNYENSDRLVSLIATGANATETAIAVFDSLQCK